MNIEENVMAVADTKPKISTDEVNHWLQRYYSLNGRLESLPGDRDLNFKLINDNDEKFVCKIGDVSEGINVLSAQNALMAYLNQCNFPAIPNVVISNEGESLINVTADDGDTYVLRVLTYIPGKPMAEFSPYSYELIRDFGRTMGLLDRALSGFDHPSFHYHFNWDLDKAVNVVEKYHLLISNKEVAKHVRQNLLDFKNSVEPHFDTLRKSVIHNDANDYNILVNGNRVTGIIDFGDVIYSYSICDLAIATAYAVLEAEDILRVITEMAIGYNETMTIENDELIVLFPMIRMRLAVSACMSAYQVSLRPDDDYLVISQEPIRNTLPSLMLLDVLEVEQHLREALS
jgi:Ser/Thr protein kinase RdoA (MazF antagonist)